MSTTSFTTPAPTLNVTTSETSKTPKSTTKLSDTPKTSTIGRDVIVSRDDKDKD